MSVRKFKVIYYLFVFICCGFVCHGSEDGGYSGVNKSPIKALERSIGSGNDLTSPMVLDMSKKLEALQQTEGRSSERAADGVVEYACSKLGLDLDEEANSVSLNNGLLGAFGSPDHNKKKRAATLIEVASKKASKAVKRQCLVVDTQHAVVGEVKRKSPTSKVKGLSGRHSIDSYNAGELEPHCVIGQCGLTLGVLAFGKTKKTVKFGMTEATVIENRKKARLFATKVATDPLQSDLIVSKVSKNGFLGSYPSKNHLLVDNTQFPLLVAKRKKKSNEDITLVRLAKLNSGYKSLESSSRPLVVSPDIFDSMMKKGSPLKTVEKEVSMVDITDPIQNKFGGDLIAHGFSNGKLPSPVYGLR